MSSPGQSLAGGFYLDVVGPLVAEPHAAALVGEGSEVLGLDDRRSTDHSWGPRLHLFVEPASVAVVTRRVEDGLPETYRGHPVSFYAWQGERIRHHVTVTTVEAWLASELRTSWPIESADTWLSLPQQRLLQATAGPIFHDDQGDLTRARERLAYFPDDVWWWLQASQWQLIAGVEALPGRLAEHGDPRGARLACGRLARLAMELAFLHERRYLPYAKWFAAAFDRLDRAARIGPVIDALLGATSADGQAAAVRMVLQAAGDAHNAITPGDRLDARCRPFEVGVDDVRRPYQVINAHRFVRACLNQVGHPGLRQLPPVGSIDQLTHSSDLLVNFTDWASRLGGIYRGLIGAPG